MVNKLYTLKHNARRAAKQALGKAAREGTDFILVGSEGGWSFRQPATPKAEPVLPAAVKPAKTKQGARVAAVARETVAEVAHALHSGQPVTLPAAPKAPRDTKQARAVAMMQRTEGASIAELAEALGWLPHTTRAFISVAVKRKLGLAVATEKTDGRGTVYRIAAQA